MRTALVERQLADRAREEGGDEAALAALLAPPAVKRLLEPEVAAWTAH